MGLSGSTESCNRRLGPIRIKVALRAHANQFSPRAAEPGPLKSKHARAPASAYHDWLADLVTFTGTVASEKFFKLEHFELVSQLFVVSIGELPAGALGSSQKNNFSKGV